MNELKNKQMNEMMMAYLTTPEILTEKQLSACQEIKNMIANAIWENHHKEAGI